MIDINQTLVELTALPVTDRLRVVESLWNSIAAETPVVLSPNERDELNRRIDAHQKNPSDLISWDQVLDQLRDRS